MAAVVPIEMSDMKKETKEIPSKTVGQKYTIHHGIVFVLTFVSYMLLHSNRKTLSYLRHDVIKVWTPQNQSDSTFNSETWSSHRFFTDTTSAEQFLGILDSVFMFCYSFGLYGSGILGDKFDPRLVLAIGMIATSIINLVFGYVTEVCGFYSQPFYIVLWVLNGFAQSAGWPPVSSIMGNWFGKDNRGLVLGVWSACSSVGNILGAHLAALALPAGYEYAFLLNASLLLAGGLVAFFGTVSSPVQLGLPVPDADNTAKIIDNKEKPRQTNQSIGFVKAILIPGVILYSVVYASLKLVNYSVFFWLPYYIQQRYDWDDGKSATISTYYDWGGIFGSILGGLISDFFGKRSPVVFVQMAFSMIFLGLYTLSPKDEVINGVLMGIAGFFVNGAVNLISSAVAADLGRQEAIKQSAEALSTVSGIVEGTGSFAAAVGQAIIPLLENKLGWNSVFYMFIILLFISLLILLRMSFRETKEIMAENRRHPFYKRLSCNWLRCKCCFNKTDS